MYLFGEGVEDFIQCYIDGDLLLGDRPPLGFGRLLSGDCPLYLFHICYLHDDTLHCEQVNRAHTRVKGGMGKVQGLGATRPVQQTRRDGRSACSNKIDERFENKRVGKREARKKRK